jgi:hypothetical protein
MKRRGVKGGTSGSTFLRLTEDNSSRIAELEFAFRDACNSCTVGNSSDITNITMSKGSLQLKMSCR